MTFASFRGTNWHAAVSIHYCMRFNFLGVCISRICNFCVLIVKFADAAYSGVEILAGEIFVDIQSESAYHNSIQQLQRCKAC